MYYPETSPSAPVSRDDLAAILAMQQQPQDPQDEYDFARQYAALTMQGHSPAAADSVVGGPFGGRGGGDREGFGENVSDPANASPTFSEPSPGYSSVSTFGRSGDDTSAQSQAAQASQAAAMAASASARGGYAPDFSQATPNADIAITGSRAPSGWGAIDVFESGHPSWGSPTLTPMSSVFDPFEGAPMTPTAPPNSFNDRWGPFASTVLPEAQTPHITVTPGRYTPASTPTPTPTPVPGGRAPTGSPGDPGGVSTGTSSPGGGGFGGGIDMSGTGGYEGSASVGNTTGAAGFTSPGGGSGFGNVGGNQGSYGSYAGAEMGGQSGATGFSGFGATGGYDPGGSTYGGGAVGGFGGGGGTGGADGTGGDTGGGGGGGGGGMDAGGSPGGVG